MSRKNQLPSFKIFDAVSMTVNQTSAVTSLAYLDNVGIQLNWTTASSTGSFVVEVSADFERDIYGNVTNTGNWASVPLTPAAASVGTSDVAYIDLNQLSAPWIRVRFIAGNLAAGTITGYITAKML